MALDYIEIKGFKSIKECKVELGPVNVLLGANGAGKSNFIGVFKLLNELVEERLQRYIKASGGANALLYCGEKETDSISIGIKSKANGYKAHLLPSTDDRLFFDFEHALYWGYGDNEQPHITPLNKQGWETELNEAASRRTRITTLDYVIEHMKAFRVYHFHDTSDSALVKKFSAVNDYDFLRSDAGNLAPFLLALKQTDPNHFKEIVRTIRLVAPFFKDFLLRPDRDNSEKMMLEWKERNSDYPLKAHQLSDGTLRFICLATLLLQPKPPSTIVIDEPELGLHPYAINVLASLLKRASKKIQVVVSTQSVSLLNNFDTGDVLVTELVEGQSKFSRLSSDKLKDWLEEYTLGELWEKNIIGGRPSL